MSKVVRLAPITRHNVGDILAVSAASRSTFYHLPQDLHDALQLIERAEGKRTNGTGDTYGAYSIANPRELVGGGDIVNHNDVASLGWWVASAYRRQGFGRAIVSALEAQVATYFPEVEELHAHIDPRNVGSLVLAARMGYVDTNEVTFGHVVYGKALPAEYAA